ncbi:ATP-binding protein [Leptolyngbya sp. FACHB-261]|uniref:ATP-binding protein n=1 Tax=Leptolyngbya sp. FACHB-261 TaxID=2692806 RepID=UPI001684A1E0|nr:ATP-binding protein [Leptolyngbya sp. FACHB-261]MBD2101964.1 response regulator [Leptolyngbya sp. FACHB-261]
MLREGEGIAAKRIFIEGGEIGCLMRSLDWSQTPLGDTAHWPQSLRSAVSILLPSKAQICLFWGPDLITIYNDAYRPALASKHPWALSRPAHEVWSEVWDVIEPLLKGVVATGEAFWARDYLFFLNRHGYIEETYFDVSYDPVRDESGKVGGVFCIVSETTGRVLGDRRLQTLSLLASETAQAKTVQAACLTAIQALATNSHDIPFALLYRVDAEGRQASLVGTTGIDAASSATPGQIDLTQGLDEWELRQVYETGEATIVDDLAARFEDLPVGAWDKPPSAAWVVPLIQAGQKQIVGLLVLGINPHRAFEQEYRKFFEVVVGNVTTAIANARGYEEERQQVEALAELDRAKTTFFNNVSHEFRTPLTLMLSPLEETLTEFDAILPAKARSQLEMVQRNGTRLLKLVNTLLDFSRIEAGRTQVSYEPIDLATYTAELTSIFRSAVEQAGLRLIVDCPSLPESVYVDREMWEKIVLNLLSNAFKFTFEGEIAVSLRPVGKQVELVVRDTGTGIPPDEVPRLFERFHRVEGAKGRTFEGTGIGLSLVQELVHLQGGTISVDSRFGQGSTFAVRLPTGTTHLPLEPQSRARSDRFNASQSHVSTASSAMSYVEEALGWLPEEDAEISLQEGENDQSSTATTQILLVDDNTDMRNYLQRILSQYYKVDVATDGETALAATYNDAPDLILSDVMMPGMNGFELLRRLRADSRTCEIPILLLSARAGEEAAVEGLEAGADDYLVKPFSRRELLARVAANLELGQSRQAGSQQRFRFLAESIPQMVWTADATGWVDYYSPRWFDYTGLTLEQIQGAGWQDLIHPEDRERTVEAWAQAVQTRTSYEVEHRLRQADRTYRWHLTRALPMLSGNMARENMLSENMLTENSQVVRWYGTCTDITEHKQTGEALGRSEERYRTLFESIDEGFCVIEMLFDENGTPNDYRFLEISPSFVSQTGLTDAQGKRIRELAPNHEKYWFEMYGKVAMTGEPVRFENWAEALHRWFDVYAFRLGQPEHRKVAVFFKDVSGRKQTEMALRESEELKRRILESSKDCIKLLTLEGRLLYLNQGGLKLLEINDPASYLNAEWISFWQGEDQEKARAAIAAAKSDQVGRFQGYSPTAKGKPKWWDVIVTAVQDASGQVAQLLVVSRDITQQKQAEAEREQLLAREQAAREQAETANRIKDEFLAVLSHELRSPLNPILGWTTLLRNGKLDAAKTTYALETIERNAKLQVQLIEDLLDISRILRGKLILNVVPVDLRAVIRAALETVRLAAEAKSLQIQTTISAGFGVINGDAGRLQQVLWNLLSNAVKFTPKGGQITVALTQAETHTQIQVSDTGKGINPDFLPYIFEHFRQEDGATTRKFGGLGLGLAIARQIVELHGGTVRAESSGEGQGATFTIKLPLLRDRKTRTRTQQDPTSLTHSALPLSNVQILVVDDEADTRELIAFVLEQAGAIVTAVPSAIAVLEVLAQGKPDVLVSDIGMPEMDGYMLMQQIRAMSPDNQILAIALTAYAGEFDQRKALAAGFQRHVSKPIEPETLVQTVVNLIARGSIASD